jgi:AmmeMemoRadiSam system protein A
MLTPLQQKAALRLAREAITSHLYQKPLRSKTKFKERGCCFVTLQKNGVLRGCIGSFVPKPLHIAIVENAIAAATKDPRFKPLTKEELKEVEIEVSILSAPKLFNYNEPNELLKQLAAKKPGVIIKCGANSATFLPQVWEQLPEPELFLSQLCIKAGLPEDAWRKLKLEVYTYGANVLCELGNRKSN